MKLRTALAAAALALASGCAAPVQAPPQASPAASDSDRDCKPMLVGCVDPFRGAPPGEARAQGSSGSLFDAADLFFATLFSR
jgi:type IV pilus biogenesis protein CpaD/CtpE